MPGFHGVKTNMRKTLFLTACFVLIAAVNLFGADPFVGVWKLNIEKSHTNMEAPPPPPKALVITYVADGEGMIVTTEVTLPEGSVRKTVHSAIYDGKDHPRFVGAAEGDTTAFTRPNPLTEESVQKHDGTTVMTTRRVVSSDGKTMTSTSKTKGPGGKEIEIVTVFDKQ
jgi:hypothetical protein